MHSTENYKIAVDRLKEAQQLLLLAIEHGAISSLDRDLFLEKIRKAYDSVLFEVEKPIVIAPIVEQPAKVKVEKVPEIPSKPVAPEVKQQVIQESEHIQQKAKPAESVPAAEKISIFDSSIKGLSKADKKIDEPIEPKPKESSILKAEQPASLAEKLQGKQKPMTDSLSNQFKEKPVASQLQSKPISDLTKEIGVHDKFLFIKELFDGDTKSYEETLQMVNQFTDISEALIYIQESFSWNDNNKAANKFIELIRRKLLNG